MKAKATLVMVDEEPTFVLEDGTIIDTCKIGYISNSYGVFDEDCFYEKFTKNDVSFVIDNNVECQIEMINDEAERVPKLYKGKVIIHFK